MWELMLSCYLRSLSFQTVAFWQQLARKWQVFLMGYWSVLLGLVLQSLLNHWIYRSPKVEELVLMNGYVSLLWKMYLHLEIVLVFLNRQGGRCFQLWLRWHLKGVIHSCYCFIREVVRVGKQGYFTQSKVIDNINFRNFLELVPEVRELIHDFYSRTYYLMRPYK